MSSPIIFDTGALIALFSKNEVDVGEQIVAHLDIRPHSPRIVYEPNLVELIYLLVKKRKLMPPKAIQQNFDHFGIEIYPLPSTSPITTCALRLFGLSRQKF